MADRALSSLDTVIHPVRLRILLALHGQERTAREVGQTLGDVPQASLYRHLSLLKDAGLVVPVGERGDGPRAEQILALNAAPPARSDAELAALTPEDMRRYFQTWMGALMEALEGYLTQEPLRVRDEGVSYFLGAAYLTDEEAVALRADILEQFKARDAAPGPGRRRRILGYVALPEPQGDGRDT